MIKNYYICVHTDTHTALVTDDKVMKNSCTCREYILSGKMNRWAILLELQWRKAKNAYQDCWSDESLQDAIEARENLTNQVSEQNWGSEGVKSVAIRGRTVKCKCITQLIEMVSATGGKGTRKKVAGMKLVI